MPVPKPGFTVLLAVISLAATAAAADNITGQWQCQMSFQGASTDAGTLVFSNNGQMTMGGQNYTYKLVGDTLQISSGYATDSYSYRLDKNNLKLSYQDGSSFDCNRQSSAAGAGGLLNTPGTNKPQAGGNEWQLNGTFCHYSGSSSYGSSYSTTSRIRFDGQGHWSMGSESSFSGDAGSAYSGGGVDNSGSYRISGQQVLYTTGAGEQGVARVNMQQRDGRITEIYVGNDLYSPSLCN